VQITGVRTLELDSNRILTERDSDEGVEQVEARMPALLTCAERLINPLAFSREVNCVVEDRGLYQTNSIR
jgi:electron transfer flavoprotein alpha/beta subunit